MNNSNLNISTISSQDEWIIEIIDKQTKLTSCLGKIFVYPTLHLNNNQLELIWDLCNYGPAQYNLQKIEEDCIYNGFEAIFAKDMIYIPIKGINHCNDNIFIRKHYDINNGYWINNNHRQEKDKWIYTNRKEFINYHKQNL